MKLYFWYRRNRKTINGILITFITSLIFNIITNISNDIFIEFDVALAQMLDPRTLAGFLTLLATLLLVLTNLVYICATRYLKKDVFTKEFIDVMKRYTSENIVDSVGNGVLSWGEGKTIQICDDIMLGWNSENVLVDTYNDELYSFFREEDRQTKFGAKSYYFPSFYTSHHEKRPSIP